MEKKWSRQQKEDPGQAGPIPRAIDMYTQKLQKTKPMEPPNVRKAKAEVFPSASIEKIIKLMRCTF